MSDLTPDEIRNYGSRALRGIASEPEIAALVSMSRRTHDAEQRAERTEGLARYWKHWAENYAGQNDRMREALRYLHSFPNAPAAHANAAKIIPSDAEFDRMARAKDAADEPTDGRG